MDWIGRLGTELGIQQAFDRGIGILDWDIQIAHEGVSEFQFFWETSTSRSCVFGIISS